MTHTIENFILEMEDFLPAEWCAHAIEYFENMQKAGLVADRSNEVSKNMYSMTTH